MFQRFKCVTLIYFRIRLAEHGKNKRGIEEIVTQLTAQLDDSQSAAIKQTPLNLSLVENKIGSYNANMSSQELYNILLNKEKYVSDMKHKVQKLEANILDLQENLKEKDSVIDARTKAITLMSENLSKKGKSTIDTLEETKLQMRKMQENFIEHEGRMNSEKQELVSDLSGKEMEIATLKDKNYILQMELDRQSEIIAKKDEEMTPNKEENERLELTNLQRKISDLETALASKSEEICQHVSKISELETVIEGKSLQLHADGLNEHINDLTKQLEESNKNMIKVKANHKGKIKELNKKINSFKQMGNANVEIAKLLDENFKLSQKIVGLEEERNLCVALAKRNYISLVMCFIFELLLTIKHVYVSNS